MYVVNDDYLAGIIDGEASFVIVVKKDERYRAGYRVITKFVLPQKNKQLLEMVREYLGFGKIYWYARDKLWYYEVYSRRDLHMLCSRICDKLVLKRNKCMRFKKILELLPPFTKYVSRETIAFIKTTWTAPETGANPP